MKLNIGCGWEKMEGFVNIDKAEEVNPDMVVNIEKGIPFPDNTFTYIYSHHTLEHIRPEHWMFVLNEISRVAKNGCILELILPFDNLAERTAIDHYRTFTWDSFCQLEVTDDNRFYYSKLKLKRLYRNPPKVVKWFFYFFPFFKGEVKYKFEIVK